jgi:Xaa-Pro aminopeptidase
LSNDRLSAARRILQSTEGGIDALLVSDMINVGYLSGFTGSTGMVLITPDENLFLTDFRYSGRARKECPGFEIVDISAPDSLKEFYSARDSLKKIGFESTNVTAARLEGWRKVSEGIEWVAVGGSVTALRMIKDDSEIALIQHAISIAQDSFLLIAPLLVPGTTESEFALELEFAMRRAGAEAVSFDSIVASGENGAYPHHSPGDRAFVDGDLVTIDWGARYKGYCSDITRTVFIGASPSDKQTDVYNAVEEAKQLAIAAIAPGKRGRDIDSIARDHIAARGYEGYFGHSLGHSLGRDVHDGMTLAQRAGELVLKPGMVTTVEPGIYIEGFGGVRIEEDVLVTETGHTVLTRPTGGL